MKLIYQDVFREIRKAPGRFISLFLIVVLGVAFYAGIRSCSPDMVETADKFYDDYNLQDIRVISTMGLTDDDVQAIEKIDGVEMARGEYSFDVYCRTEDDQSAVKIIGLTEGIDEVKLTDGRMPQKATECIVDDHFVNLYGYKIGDVLELISPDDTDIEEKIKHSQLTVTGTFVSPQYLSFDKGNTTIGSGNLSGIVLVRPEIFAVDYYTQIAILVEGAKELNCYSEKYEDAIDDVTGRLKAIKESREDARYRQILEEANAPLNEAKEKFEQGVKDLADAKEQLENAKQEIADGEVALDEARKQYQEAKEKAESEIASSQEQLDTFRKYADAVASYFGSFNSVLETLTNAREAITTVVQLIEGIDIPEEYIPQEIKDSLQTIEGSIDEIFSETGRIADDLEVLEDAGIITHSEITQMRSLADKIRYADNISDRMAAVSQLYDLNSGIYSKMPGRINSVFADYQAQLDAAKNEAQSQLDDASNEIAENAEKLDDAKTEVAENEAKIPEAEQELADAEKEIKEAEEEISKIARPEWYILGRNYLPEYTSYESDSKRIGNIGKVFPLIFFIVAALVCLTAMTRMVDEERTQIGTLKALGYSRGSIMWKYISYALLASVSGSVIGFLAGGKIFPYIIITVYKIMYPNLVGISMPYNLEHSLVASLAAIGCMSLAAFFACVKSLSEEPASLMRPVAPANSKKLLLERITGLWRKIPFTWKNAFRNFVRYKKRLFMTLFGICGSTALLLVGFGLKDAINTILYAQYGGVNKFDAQIVIDVDSSQKNQDDFIKALESDERVQSYSYVYTTIVDSEAEGSKEILTTYICVAKDADNIDEYIALKDRKSQERIELTDDAVLISEKMSNMLKLKPGDTFTVSVDQKDRKTLTVGGVVENYVEHYIYMTPVMYETLYGHEPEYNTLVVVYNDNMEVISEELSEDYLKYKAVGGIMCVDEMIDKFEDMISSLDSITYVLIVCAAALSFVVLYNLNNINISERRRELATLKVLGFYDIELSQYIYRENILITIIGVALGIVAGIFLNSFVVHTVEVDIVMFGRQIFLMSFVKSILIAVAFAALVNIIVHFKLKKIDMATSLKSVE
ncbi:MAG: FtsX-like permease family protein [Lachnospiraceae bacterium]|nr:FtsX-like permease family protein [Lachnospiraceae bacterium]